MTNSDETPRLEFPFVTLTDIPGGSPVSPHEGPDWSLWANIPTTELWKAVHLSCNVDPDTTIYFGRPEQVSDREVSKRLRQAVAHYLKNGWISVWHPDIDESYSRIDMKQFCQWAISIGWKLPPAMEKLADDASVSAEIDTVPVEKPHIKGEPWTDQQIAQLSKEHRELKLSGSRNYTQALAKKYDITEAAIGALLRRVRTNKKRNSLADLVSGKKK